MVDKTKRLQAAELIRKFMTCKVTNFQFRDGFPRSKEDPALHAINTMLWFAYVREHRLEGKHRLGLKPRTFLSDVSCSCEL
jgi:hypothetical protein